MLPTALSTEHTRLSLDGTRIKHIFRWHQKLPCVLLSPPWSPKIYGCINQLGIVRLQKTTSAMCVSHHYPIIVCGHRARRQKVNSFWVGNLKSSEYPSVYVREIIHPLCRASCGDGHSSSLLSSICLESISGHRYITATVPVRLRQFNKGWRYNEKRNMMHWSFIDSTQSTCHLETIMREITRVYGSTFNGRAEFGGSLMNARRLN